MTKLTESDLRRMQETGEIYGPSTLDDPDGIMAYGAPIGDPDPTRRLPWWVWVWVGVVVLLALVALSVV